MTSAGRLEVTDKGREATCDNGPMPQEKSEPVTVSETLRTAIQENELSLYRIAKDSGVSYAALHRFASGKRAISMDAIDRLASYLGLALRRL